MRAGVCQSYEDGRTLLQIPFFPGRKLPFLKDLAEELAFNHAASRWVKKHAAQFDIVHVQGRSGFTLPGRIGDTPVISTFHGLVSVENKMSGPAARKSLSTRLHETWATWYERKALNRSDAVIAVSQEMLDELHQLAPGIDFPAKIISNGVDLIPDAETMVQPDPKLLLFVGRLHLIKGVYTLIESMKQADPDLKLVMVGDGPERTNLEHEIRKAGLSDRIQLTGALNQTQVFQWLQRAAALVVPSFHETQGIVLLEAFTSKKTVIASNIPAIRDIVQPGVNGLLFTPGQSDELTRCMAWIGHNPVQAAIMGRNGQALVAERFDWEQIALETERLYGQVLAARNEERIHQLLRSNSCCVAL